MGKTYAMLNEARRRHERGAPTWWSASSRRHGRRHTEAQIGDLEVIPRRTSTYRGAEFEEMDVDALLARRPAVALVDELAHTNIPGRRNDKRWQDVEELLAAGIDVITTVNIQHLESLNDVVQKITGIPQRETVPDAVVRRGRPDRTGRHGPARRCAGGWPTATSTAEKVDAALSNYFRVGNLAALRELALLWVADRVDDSLQHYRDRARHRPGLGDPRAGGGRAHRRARGRDAHPPGGPHRAPDGRRRAARRARHPQRRPGRASPGALATQRQLLESLGGSYHVVVGDDSPPRCSASPAPSTPPSWCWAPAGAAGSPAS